MSAAPMDFSILVVDDDPDMVDMLGDVLGDKGYRVLRAGSGAAALQLAASEHPDLLISDLRMSGMTGHQLQARLKAVTPELPVVIITAFGSIQTAIESMRLGAFDYITKPFSNDELTLVVERALEDRRLRREVIRLRGELAERYGFDTIVDAQPADARATGDSAPDGRQPGQRSDHRRKRNRQRPGRARAALPQRAPRRSVCRDQLRRDSRRSARKRVVRPRTRRVHRRAPGQDRLFQAATAARCSSTRSARCRWRCRPSCCACSRTARAPGRRHRETPVDVRVVAATNAKLEAAIASGRFRTDLYYRIATVTIAIAPLRERPEDIAMLARHFAARAAAESGHPPLAIDDDAIDLLLRHPWPGNVRELQNAIQYALVLCTGDRITRDDLPPRIAGGNPERINLEGAVAQRMPLEQLEREYIRATLAAVDGNKSECAAILGIDRKTLYRKLDDLAAVPDSGAARQLRPPRR